MQQKTITFLSLVLSVFFFFSCASNSKMGENSEVVQSREGWIDEDTYQMEVIGLWDRSQYYIEGEEDEVDGKSPKSAFGLKADSKTAAKVKAMRNFREKMISDIQGENSS